MSWIPSALALLVIVGTPFGIYALIRRGDHVRFLSMPLVAILLVVVILVARRLALV